MGGLSGFRHQKGIETNSLGGMGGRIRDWIKTRDVAEGKFLVSQLSMFLSFSEQKKSILAGKN